MRHLTLLACLLGSATWALAEEPVPDEAQIRSRLQSDIALENAWGLERATNEELEGTETDVVRILVRTQDDDSFAGRRLRTAALDAAILLEVDLPAALLGRLAARIAPSRLLLLARRDPLRHRAHLLRLLEDPPSDEAWQAVCNLLLPVRDPALVRHLLSGLRLRTRVTVHDVGDEETLFGGASITSGHAIGCGRRSPPEEAGWPPLYEWVYGTWDTGDSVLVAAGRRPIYAHRRRIPESGFG